MKKTLIVFLLSACFSVFARSPQFDRIAIFGDSLSDNGNLYKYSMHIIPKSPPYYHGHFANGPIWGEKLVDLYFGKQGKHLIDYAVGGAGAIISKKENLPYTLWTEINEYLYLHSFEHKDTTLYVVWMGANNYLNGPTNVDSITSSVVKGISDGIKKLIHHGAVMVMIANLPDMGVTPEIRKKGRSELLHRLTRMHNDKLYAEYLALQEHYPNVTFIYYDSDALFTELLKQPAKFGITNIKEPCFSGSYTFNHKALTDADLVSFLKQQGGSESSLSETRIKQILANPALRTSVEAALTSSLNGAKSLGTQSCPGFLFWDGVHPTSYMHSYMAIYMKYAIDDAGVVVKR